MTVTGAADAGGGAVDDVAIVAVTAAAAVAGDVDSAGPVGGGGTKVGGCGRVTDWGVRSPAQGVSRSGVKTLVRGGLSGA